LVVRLKDKEKWKSWTLFLIFATLGSVFTTKYLYGITYQEYKGIGAGRG
jgi:hypothetical protein